MKTFLLILVLCGSIQAKDLGTDITRVGTGAGSVAARAKKVIFIFDNPCVVFFVGGTFTYADRIHTLTAPTGDTLSAISYNVTSGGMRIIREQ